jgi:hypothetical protein
MHKIQSPSTSAHENKNKKKEGKKKQILQKNKTKQNKIMYFNTLSYSWFHNSKCFKP